MFSPKNGYSGKALRVFQTTCWQEGPSNCEQTIPACGDRAGPDSVWTIWLLSCSSIGQAMRSRQHGRADHDVDSGETRGHAPLHGFPFTPLKQREIWVSLFVRRDYWFLSNKWKPMPCSSIDHLFLGLTHPLTPVWCQL